MCSIIIRLLPYLSSHAGKENTFRGFVTEGLPDPLRKASPTFALQVLGMAVAPADGDRFADP